MALSFDPDFQPSGAVIDTDLVCTLPAGDEGDLMVAYILAGVPAGGLNGVHLDGWTHHASAIYSNQHGLHAYAKTREAAETVHTFVTSDDVARRLCAIVLNIPASVANQPVAEVNGQFLTDEGDVPYSKEYADVVKYLTGATALIDTVGGALGVHVTLDSAGEYEELEQRFVDGDGYETMIDAWVYEPGATSPTLTISDDTDPSLDLISVWLKDAPVDDPVADPATEGWVTGRVAFG